MRPASDIANQICGCSNRDQHQRDIALIEADRKQVREDTVREVVRYLIEDNGMCDCFARSESECACGGWDDYKRKPLLDVADEIERKFFWEKA